VVGATLHVAFLLLQAHEVQQCVEICYRL